MADKRITVQIAGLGTVEGTEVSVEESTERWTEIKLTDGSVLRMKPVVVGALRVEGRYDPEGNPLYSLKINPVMAVVSSPEDLRQPPPGAGAPKPH